ncbi:MAG: hypothetical protein HY021_10945, partial [Burkholderiales bacterium]|nr:hypothetical protein [Burkholderiales bacterium]
MDLVNLAVAVVFVSNAAILILLVFMLLRILGETERTRQMMVTSSREMNDSARVVRDAGYQVRDALRNGLPAAASGRAAESGEATMTATPVPGIEALDKL